MVHLLIGLIMCYQVITQHVEDQIYIQDIKDLESVESVEYTFESLSGMVVPHHLVALDKLSGMYKSYGSDSVKHVVLMSPDHFTNSNRPILTSTKDFYGAFGYLKNHTAFTTEMLALDYVYADDTEIIQEHGLYAHIPLIKRYFPNAEISVFAISKQTKKEDIDLFMSKIPKESFLIGSVDFSHYYNRFRADEFDEVTRNLINLGQYESFFGMSDAYFDSPGVLYTVLTWGMLHKKAIDIVDHGNSADYYSNNIHETTSYFFLTLKK